jgi:teichuronic acid biosynthesis glycosyltransferase TuaH
VKTTQANTLLTATASPPLPETPVVRGRDILVIGLQPWYYEIGSNCKNIATHLSKENRVLYVNAPITRKTYFSKEKNKGVAAHCNIIRDKAETIKPIRENMWEFYPTTLLESINSLPSTRLFRTLNRVNNRRFAKDIKKGIRKLGFNDVILFNDNDIYNGFHLKEFLSPELYIYYCRDFLQGYSYWKKHTSVLEPLLIKKADFTVANSIFYSEFCAGYNPHSYYMGQGCNFDLFDHTASYAVPEDLKTIPSPIIGYVGSLDSARLDPAILQELARQKPDWNIVLVGPEDEFFLNSDLHGISNIHFLGRKPLEQLGAYVARFDVCMNPQLSNIITRGNYPLKIDEYLAMGKPVVATRTRAMKLFEEYTYLADSPDQYPQLAEQALQENSNEKAEARIKFARSHTWENSMQDLYKAILKHTGK